ncbi:type IV pilin [Haloarcula hispanica]|uniref:Type IV pilin n=1 Tax=Haloarcula hispanica TaxID=51589 RepID=A0A482TFS1_HALHI|nr:type IV pilin [Haloarcula hispanica]MCJ0619491.1 type IV pilin [Haloarcula hispanica]RYJ09973.1 type IV pilin [Haloarcula hispanica]
MNPDTSAQSHVVGVVLLLGLTVVALGGLTAVVGSVVDGHTTTADEARVADTFETTFRPVEQTGHQTARVRFTEGRLTTAGRELRVLNDSGVQRTVPIDAIVYDSGDSRVRFLGGSVVRGTAGNAWLESDPPVTATRDDTAVIVGAPLVNASGGTVSGTGGVSAHIRQNVSHERERLPADNYSVAIETETPRPFTESFQRVGATTRVRDIDGDGVQSVVATFPGRRTLYLVRHDMRTEVGHG